MRYYRIYLIAVLVVLLSFVLTCAQSPEDKNFREVQFKSLDNIMITGDLYLTNNPAAPFIILFHQAGWSRGEYREIAPKLNHMGFNCLAIDQRSGAEVNGVTNQTHAQALKKQLPTTYLDAYGDMEAALAFVRHTYHPQKLIIWGSSYSAALSLKLCADHNNEVQGVLAFSPGEYFEKLGKTDHFITESVKSLRCPVFVTSAKRERAAWQPIFDSIPVKQKVSFIPESRGNHGSRALWEKFEDSSAYWQAVQKFLSRFVEK